MAIAHIALFANIGCKLAGGYRILFYFVGDANKSYSLISGHMGSTIISREISLENGKLMSRNSTLLDRNIARYAI